MLTLSESVKRDNVATLNANALAALPREFPAVRFANVRFGYERSEWRATRRNGGTLRGLEHLGRLTVLATDGVQAWYATHDGVMQGHIASFSGKVEPLFSAKTHTTSAKREHAERKISPRQALLASL